MTQPCQPYRKGSASDLFCDCQDGFGGHRCALPAASAGSTTALGQQIASDAQDAGCNVEPPLLSPGDEAAYVPVYAGTECGEDCWVPL